MIKLRAGSRKAGVRLRERSAEWPRRVDNNLARAIGEGKQVARHIRDDLSGLPMERGKVARCQVMGPGQRLQRGPAARELPIDRLHQRARGFQCSLLDDRALALVGVSNEQFCSDPRRQHGGGHQTDELLNELIQRDLRVIVTRGSTLAATRRTSSR